MWVIVLVAVIEDENDISEDDELSISYMIPLRFLLLYFFSFIGSGGGGGITP